MVRTRVFSFVALLAAFQTMVIRAEAFDAEEDALRMTQQMMTSPDQRKLMMRGLKDATSADKNLNAIAGDPQTAQKIYELAADVLGSMSRQNGFDPDKMQRMLDLGTMDPSWFAGTFTPEQKYKLQQLGATIETKKAVP